MQAATVARALLSAARFGGETIRDPAVGASWNQSSALRRMTVGDVAGHLFLVVRRVNKRLDDSLDLNEAGAPFGGMIYPRVDQPGDLDLDIHEQVRRDARHVAEWGWSELYRAYADRLAELDRRLASGIPDAIAFGDRRMDSGEYLASRVVEVLVHVDDLAVSVGAPFRAPPEDAVEVALVHLLGAARRVHGDLALLRAFTRRERVPSGVPSIF
jgi:hypothetical protein